MKTHSMTAHSRNVDFSRFSWPQEELSREDAEAILEDCVHDAAMKKYPVRDFLAAHFEDYCQSHKIPEEKLRVMNAIISCKTGKPGYTLTRCTCCGDIQMHACACGNKNCPSCGYLDEKKWIAMRQAEIIPDIPYFHLIFTLPHELNGIMYQNQRETLDLLFRSVKDTILTLAMDKLKMIPGILMILHTFGSNLSLHYHLHVLVSGGGLTQDKKEFKKCLSNSFFLPEKALSRLYKGKFLSGMKELHDKEQLRYLNDAQKYRNSYEWKELLDHCYKVDWNVEIRPLAPLSSTKVPDKAIEKVDNVIGYFARYTNRTAISNSRILDYDNDSIRFRYKKYNGTSYSMETMELSTDEFIRRFLMHILPKGFTRVRSAGFLAGCVRKKNLELIHNLLDMEYNECPVKSMGSAELIKHFFDRDIDKCEICHGELSIYPRVTPDTALYYIRAG